MPPRHVPALDGLRALAVMLVLWCHVPLNTVSYPEWLGIGHWLIGPGGLGVEIFFVLSGFLITRILLAERATAVPVRWFLLRRLLRIFPIYYLLLLVMLPFRPTAEIAWCALYGYNVRTIFWPEGGPLDHTWSLCVEEHFYLLWPLLLTFTKPTLASRLLTRMVMPAAVLGAVAVCAYFANETSQLIIQHGSPFRFLGLGAGCLLAFNEQYLRAQPRRATAIACGLLAIALLLHPHFLFLFGPYWAGTGEWVPMRFSPANWLVHSSALCTGIVLLVIVGGDQRWAPLRWLNAAPLRAIGRISYALYLYHLPIYVAVLGEVPTPMRAGAAIALTFAAATVSYFVIERPLQRFGSRFRGKPLTPHPAPTTAQV